MNVVQLAEQEHGKNAAMKALSQEKDVSWIDATESSSQPYLLYGVIALEPLLMMSLDCFYWSHLFVPVLTSSFQHCVKLDSFSGSSQPYFLFGAIGSERLLVSSLDGHLLSYSYLYHSLALALVCLDFDSVLIPPSGSVSFLEGVI